LRFTIALYVFFITTHGSGKDFLEKKQKKKKKKKKKKKEKRKKKKEKRK